MTCSGGAERGATKAGVLPADGPLLHTVVAAADRGPADEAGVVLPEMAKDDVCGVATPPTARGTLGTVTCSAMTWAAGAVFPGLPLWGRSVCF